MGFVKIADEWFDIFFCFQDENDFHNLMNNEKKEIDPKILNEVVEAIEKIKYGEVVITVHNSKVVQIEKKEKKRFS